MGEQDFGGIWTTKKLDVIDRYLGVYVQALKKQKFKLCYIDAFAGSGKVKIKTGEEIDGSAIRALKYNFDNFNFFECDKANYEALKIRIKKDYPDKANKIIILNQDCNELLMKINEFEWFANNWRGVIFLDPYAMHLSWKCLDEISQTKVFDVWYLFPFSAVNRNLYNNGNIPSKNREAITRILGTTDWERIIYKESDQLTMFKTRDLEKEGTESIKAYIIERLQTVFPTVSKNAVFLRNEKNSPVFLLCFAGSNPSFPAKELSLRVANHILSKI